MQQSLKIPGMTPTTTENTQSVGVVPRPRLPSKLKIETGKDILSSEKVYKILNYGPPGSGKSHFGMTMPEPIKFVETEQRMQLILGKFKVCNECGKEWYTNTLSCPKCSSKNIRLKDISRVKVNTMDEMYEGVEMMLEELRVEKEATGRVGTLALDSYTEFWNEAKTEYITKAGKTGKLNPREDFGVINPRHNDLRKKILESGFNVYFTATQDDIFSQDDQFKIIGVKPSGQKYNQHAVDWLIHSFFQGDIMVSTLEKNGVTKRSPATYKELDFEELIKVKESFERSEHMITAEIYEKLQKEYEEMNAIIPEEEVPEDETKPDDIPSETTEPDTVEEVQGENESPNAKGEQIEEETPPEPEQESKEEEEPTTESEQEPEPEPKEEKKTTPKPKEEPVIEVEEKTIEKTKTRGLTPIII